MSDGPEDFLMASWCRDYAKDPRVLAWLQRNPPPAEWQGTALEYAYTEMPTGLGRFA